jgi:molybdopterin converting factor small subunit
VKMIAVTVRCLGAFAEAARSASENVIVEDGATVGTVFARLVDKSGPAFASLAGGASRSGVVFATGGTMAGESTILRDGDELVIFQPVGGG